MLQNGNLDDVMTVSGREIPATVINDLRQWMRTGKYTERTLAERAGMLMRLHNGSPGAPPVIAARLILLHAKRGDIVRAGEGIQSKLWCWNGQKRSGATPSHPSPIRTETRQAAAR